ncbi:MAG TPA: tetratricopeptide repeat protein [Thiobacillaceae bacterium]|nr:tetratricopeptide repeat protein [Thiobacillaceae bacterium]
MKFDHWRYTVRGVLMEWLRRPEAAIEAYQGALRSLPTDVKALRSIAWLHAQRQRWDQAADGFRKALEVEPGHADTWFNLGFAQDKLGDRRAAGAAFSHATELDPRHDRAWYGLGLVHAHLGDHAAAAAALRHAADLQPMNGPAWLALGLAYHHSNDPDAVKRVVEHCATHDPQTARRLIQEANRADLAALLER